jgi:glyceraldehyde 3-phosphate dehydrogenase
VPQSHRSGDPCAQRQAERPRPARAGKTGSVTELVAILGKKVTVEEINAALKKATQGNKSFGYTDEEIVSSDVIGSHYGSVFDATQTEVSEAGDLQLVKAVAWYDNEYGL